MDRDDPPPGRLLTSFARRSRLSNEDIANLDGDLELGAQQSGGRGLIPASSALHRDAFDPTVLIELHRDHILGDVVRKGEVEHADALLAVIRPPAVAPRSRCRYRCRSMSSAQTVAAFLPSLEMARAAKASAMARVWWRRSGVDLLKRDPSETREVAALVTIVRRRGEAPETLFRYPYVPSMPFALEEGTARLLERTSDEPPACLRVDVERRGGGDPYRGMSSATPSFHGFDYGDALSQVRERLVQLRAANPPGTLDVETYAWPILRLSYRGIAVRRELAMLVRADGVLHAMLCKGSWL